MLVSENGVLHSAFPHFWTCEKGHVVIWDLRGTPRTNPNSTQKNPEDIVEYWIATRTQQLGCNEQYPLVN